MKRRDFIDCACRYTILCASPLVLATLQSCEDTDESVNTDDFTDVNKNYIEFDLNISPFNKLKTINGSIAIPGNDFDVTGLLLFRLSENSILAFSRRCTHSGHQVDEFANGSAKCNSHGSIFDLSGSPTRGPAKSKLTQYKVEIIDNIIRVSKK